MVDLLQRDGVFQAHTEMSASPRGSEEPWEWIKHVAEFSEAYGFEERRNMAGNREAFTLLHYRNTPARMLRSREDVFLRLYNGGAVDQLPDLRLALEQHAPVSDNPRVSHQLG